MSVTTDFYRDRAKQAHADAEGATLDNVREPALRAESAWAAIADRAERTQKLRTAREAPVLAQNPIE